jgi:Ca-activated chloride channel family protein
MRFARPEFLFCLLLIPPLIIFFIKTFRKKREALSQFGEMPLIRAVSSLPSVKRQVIKTVFCILSLILIIFSLAQPQTGLTEKKVKGNSIDIVFAIDTSLSMQANDVKPNRLEVAKKELYDLLNSFKGERVGIVAFSGTALALCPLTVDYNVIRYFLDTLDSETVITLGTSLGDAIDVASRLFDELSRVKTIVLLSDGEEHETALPGLEDITREAKADGIKIFALGIGTTIGSYIPMIDKESEAIVYKKDMQGEIINSRLEELILQKLCTLTEGGYYRFLSTATERSKGIKENKLKRIYADILEVSKKTPKILPKEGEPAAGVTGQPKRAALVYTDIFQYSTSLAIIFLLLNILIPEQAGTRRTSPPQGASVILLILTTFLVLGWVPWGQTASRIKEGNTLFNEKKYEDAFLKYKEAQQYEPDQPVINFNIGNIYYLKEAYKEALEEFHAATSSDDRALLANTFFNRGNTEYRLGLLDEAAQSYKKVLELDPSDKDAKYNLELVKREMAKRKKEKKEKPPTPDDKEKKKKEEDERKEKDKSGAKKEMQPYGSPPSGKPGPESETTDDTKKKKKEEKESKVITREHAFDFLKGHKPREQEEQKISGWFRLRKKHLGKDW